MNKYGLKNVAERKFVQLIASCIIYKDQLPRINLFARFLEIYDDLPLDDYNLYLRLIGTFSQQILNFKIDENVESTLLPLVTLPRLTRLRDVQSTISSSSSSKNMCLASSSITSRR